MNIRVEPPVCGTPAWEFSLPAPCCKFICSSESLHGVASGGSIWPGTTAALEKAIIYKAVLQHEDKRRRMAKSGESGGMRFSTIRFGVE